ncbi:hypothetical protein AURDEDRAFT_175783 [Auricularia subglabra TFB-10046 SS5]|uniref:Uncharacterized protein n=1 Tax=Auricularia subglabra (strain TFB-10046 / SS5) TaxID=717982 RepID=J0CWT3_AURST|nr:hypothetical protein AURDEDRAFT_175783 [Auricularia subglabra TFB-10046 SS5]
MDALKVHHQNFWDTCLILLDTYATGQVYSLRPFLRASQLTCPGRFGLHVIPIRDDTRDPFGIYILALNRAVGFSLRRGTKPLLNPGHSTKGLDKKRRHWPPSLEQRFPRGVARGVDVLVHSCCTLQSMLCDFTIVVPGHVKPRLLASPRRERLCWAFLQALHPAAFPWHGRVPLTMPRGLRIPDGVRGDYATVQSAVVLMHTILAAQSQDLDGGGPDTRRTSSRYQSTP